MFMFNALRALSAFIVTFPDTTIEFSLKVPNSVTANVSISVPDDKVCNFTERFTLKNTKNHSSGPQYEFSYSHTRTVAEVIIFKIHCVEARSIDLTYSVTGLGQIDNKNSIDDYGALMTQMMESVNQSADNVQIKLDNYKNLKDVLNQSLNNFSASTKVLAFICLVIGNFIPAAAVYIIAKSIDEYALPSII